MDGIKNLVGDAGTFFTRAVQDAHISDEASVMYSRAKQFTEEKLGKAERTDLDPHFEDLGRKTDKVKTYTEKLVKDTEAVLVPNPAVRVETFMFENIPVDKIGFSNKRQSNLEYLGSDMIEGGNEFGAGTPYGSALIRVGQTEQALGEIEREYIRHAHEGMCGPLDRFLEGEMRNITRERKILENKRLDLDSCKNKVRKARAMQLQPVKEGIDPRILLDQAESELRVSQAEFDKQVEITKLLMDGLKAIQTNHLRHLKTFVEVQAKYYANCHQIMQDVQKELASTTTMAVGESVTPVLRPGVVSSDVIPQAPPPGVPVVGPPTQVPGFNPAMNNHANAPPLPVQGNPYQPQQQGHNGLPNSNPFESGPGPQDSPMHQISLTSPPHVPTNMRNAEFY